MPAPGGRSWVTRTTLQWRPVPFAHVTDLCGHPLMAMIALPRNARSAVPGGNLVTIAALPLPADMPVPEGQSCLAGVALPHAGGSVAPPLPALSRNSYTLAGTNSAVTRVEDVYAVRTPPEGTPPSRTPLGCTPNIGLRMACPDAAPFKTDSN